MIYLLMLASARSQTLKECPIGLPQPVPPRPALSSFCPYSQEDRSAKCVRKGMQALVPGSACVRFDIGVTAILSAEISLHCFMRKRFTPGFMGGCLPACGCTNPSGRSSPGPGTHLPEREEVHSIAAGGMDHRYALELLVFQASAHDRGCAPAADGCWPGATGGPETASVAGRHLPHSEGHFTI